MIIGISGNIGAGKDLFASLIQEIDPKWDIKKFATPLKQVASSLTGIPVADFESQDVKQRFLGAEWGMTVREFLQKLGTDAIRNGLHMDTFVNALLSKYTQDENWLITDCRFPNEAKAIKDRGGIVIKITGRGDINGTHESEGALSDWKFDRVVWNIPQMSIEDLRYEATDFLLNIA